MLTCLLSRHLRCDEVSSTEKRVVFKAKILAVLTLLTLVFYLKMVKKMTNQLPRRNVNWTLGSRQRRRSYRQDVLALAVMRISMNMDPFAGMGDKYMFTEFFSPVG